MKKTKIVCTIGPSSESKEMLSQLIDAGMNVIRLNFSHGGFEEQSQRIENIRAVDREKNTNTAILLDTKGPEIRLGVFANGVEEYNEGDTITLVREEIVGDHSRVHVQCPEIFDDLEVGGRVLVDDGKVGLKVVEKGDGFLVCRLENSGALKSKKGCNVPGVRLSMPFISPKDDADIRFACRQKLDFIAASFTRRRDDVLAIKKILAEENNQDIKIIVKIENQEGVDNIVDILEEADGVMVARGDLGVDVSYELVPLYQKHIIKVANEMGKPVITATHMLDSMVSSPRPTRAEVNDVANAILDGTDAIMLSAESAAGKYPRESVETMSRIAKMMEATIDYQRLLEEAIKTNSRTKQDAIAIAVAEATHALDIAGVIAFTQSGKTAQRISKFRPKAPVIAVTFDSKVERSLAVKWGVQTVLYQNEYREDREIEIASEVARQAGIPTGSTIIIVAGHPAGEGKTNSLQIVEVK